MTATSASSAGSNLPRLFRGPRACCALLLVAGLTCYAGSLHAPMVFDDQVAIVDNPAIRTLVDGISLQNPRGLVLWTFAVNYLFGEVDPLGYHLVNLAIHVLAGLTLFGLVRRTLAGHKLAPRFAAAADGLALAAALVWLVHPLATSAVTYICQRFESAAALCYLFGLYAFCRGTEAKRERGWLGIVVLAYALGLRTKETMITFPLVLLWYDRALVADRWRDVLARWWLYLALAAVTLLEAGTPLAAVVTTLAAGASGSSAAGTDPGPYRGDALVVAGVTPRDYLLSQPGVIWHYLRLCFWPIPLCLDYGWPVAHAPGQVWPPLLAILALWGTIAWGVFRRPSAAFLGGAFFLVLAPSSSLIPIKDLMFEHRMYLPLAAVVVLVVTAGYRCTERIRARVAAGSRRARGIALARPALVALAALVLGSLTVARNHDYRSARALHAHDCAVRPDYWRPHLSLALALEADGDSAGAEAELSRALDLCPSGRACGTAVPCCANRSVGPPRRSTISTSRCVSPPTTPTRITTADYCCSIRDNTPGPATIAGARSSWPRGTSRPSACCRKPRPGCSRQRRPIRPRYPASSRMSTRRPNEPGG